MLAPHPPSGAHHRGYSLSIFVCPASEIVPQDILALGWKRWFSIFMTKRKLPRSEWLHLMWKKASSVVEARKTVIWPIFGFRMVFFLGSRRPASTFSGQVLSLLRNGCSYIHCLLHSHATRQNSAFYAPLQSVLTSPRIISSPNTRHRIVNYVFFTIPGSLNSYWYCPG